MQSLIRYLMHTRIYKYLLARVIPYVRFTTYYPSFKGYNYHRGYNVLEPGDIILQLDQRKLTSALIPGNWSHAALCISKDQVWEVSEMTHENYRKSCFFDLCKEADRIAILRCRDFDKDYVKKVIERCRLFENTSYDSAFELGIKDLYCSELIYQSDLERRLKVKLEMLPSGEAYISPDGLYAAENCDLIFEN